MKRAAKEREAGECQTAASGCPSRQLQSQRTGPIRTGIPITRHWASPQWSVAQLCQKYGFDLDTPYRRLPESARHVLMHGDKEKMSFTFERAGTSYNFESRFEGVLTILARRYKETGSMRLREQHESDMAMNPCDLG